MALTPCCLGAIRQKFVPELFSRTSSGLKARWQTILALHFSLVFVHKKDLPIYKVLDLSSASPFGFCPSLPLP